MFHGNIETDNGVLACNNPIPSSHLSQHTHLQKASLTWIRYPIPNVLSFSELGTHGPQHFLQVNRRGGPVQMWPSGLLDGKKYMESFDTEEEDVASYWHKGLAQ